MVRCTLGALAVLPALPEATERNVCRLGRQFKAVMHHCFCRVLSHCRNASPAMLPSALEEERGIDGSRMTSVRGMCTKNPGRIPRENCLSIF